MYHEYRANFSNEGRQAVRIPKEYRFDVDEVYINKIGNVLVWFLYPKQNWRQSLKLVLPCFQKIFWLKGCRTVFLPLGRHCNVYVGYECQHYGSEASGLANL